MSPPKSRSGVSITPDGKNLFFTFASVSSLFVLWGFWNGMIDVMDKHFQEEMHLSLSQSTWVQFVHHLGYFLMSLPAGWLATRLGYKGIGARLLKKFAAHRVLGGYVALSVERAAIVFCKLGSLSTACVS